MEEIFKSNALMVQEDQDKYYIKNKLADGHFFIEYFIKIIGDNDSERFKIPMGHSTLNKSPDNTILLCTGTDTLSVISAKRSENSLIIRLPDRFDKNTFDSIYSADDNSEHYKIEDIEDSPINFKFYGNKLVISGLVEGLDYKIDGTYSSGDEFTLNNLYSDLKFVDLKSVGSTVQVVTPSKVSGNFSIDVDYLEETIQREFGNEEEMNIQLPLPECINCNVSHLPKVFLSPHIYTYDEHFESRGYYNDFRNKLPKDNFIEVEFPSWFVFNLNLDRDYPNRDFSMESPLKLKIDMINKIDKGEVFRPYQYLDEVVKSKKIVKKSSLDTMKPDGRDVNVDNYHVDIYFEDWQDVTVEVIKGFTDEPKEVYNIGDSNKSRISLGSPVRTKLVIKGKENKKIVELAEEETKYTRSIVV